MPSDGLNVQERNESRMPAEFSLRQGLGVWELTFAGEKAILRHEQGLAYVGWLLAHPGESILALDLVTQVAAANREHGGMAEIVDPATGRRLALQSDARLQERALSLDAKTMRTVLRRQEELEALVEQDDEIEPVKEEAYRELIALYDYEKRNGTRVRDGAAKASDAVGQAVRRLQKRLRAGRNPHGAAEVLRAFADHIYDHILIPSGRAAGHGGSRVKRGCGGHFVYEAPEGAKWNF